VEGDELGAMSTRWLWIYVEAERQTTVGLPLGKL
jgi:hypothetical protein